MTRTTTSTDWTERYLAAVLGGIPEPKRADVERELRSSIADAVEERVGGGEDRQAAERAVLESLGDPSQLAAGYTGRPGYLIGPELFPIYRHFIPRLIAAAAPIAAVVLAIVKVAGGGSFGDGIGAGINGAINVTIQIAFWGTVIFVVLERADSFRDARDEIVSATGNWTLERLPKTSVGRVTMGEAVGEIVTVLITIGGIIFFMQATALADGRGPILGPAFTGFWYPIFIAVLAGQAVLQVIGFVVGRWTIPLAIGHAALQLAFALPLIWLALSSQLIDHGFANHFPGLRLADGDAPVMLIVAVSTALASGWEIFRSFRRARVTLLR